MRAATDIVFENVKEMEDITIDEDSKVESF